MNWNKLNMSQKNELMQIYLKNGITSLDEMKKHYNSFAEGGKLNIPPFAKRYSEGQRRAIPTSQGPATHYMAADEADGKYYAYPTVQPIDYNDTNSPLKYYGNRAFDRALENNDVMEFNLLDDAIKYSENYKRPPSTGAYLNNDNTPAYSPYDYVRSFAKGSSTGIPPERFFGIATPEVTNNNVYQPTYGTLLPEVKVNAERPYLTDYDLARLRSGQISSETAKSIAQKRATGTSGFMEDLNRLSNPMHEGLSGYRKFMNEHPSFELAYDAASAGLSGFPFTAPIGYTMAGIDLLSGIDDMAYNGLSFDNIIDVLGVIPAAKYSKTIKGVEGAKKGLRYRRGIPDVTINPIGTPIFLGEILSDIIDAKNVGEDKINNAEPYATGGKIHIKPENRGKFTALKKRTGHSASWFKENGTPAQKKQATFALNAKKWKH